jgi:hypothetical protein
VVFLLENKGSVTGSKGRVWIYVPTGVAKDSAFPFKKGEKVNVKIEGDKLVIAKEK